MAFTEIQFHNYRNIKDTKIENFKKNNFIIGLNGQGKTNFLEALYLLTYNSSFKPKKEQNFISAGKDFCHVSCKKTIDQRNLKFKYFEDLKKKEFQINDAKLKSRIELIYYDPTIIFKHDDIFLINGSPEIKRNFFDQLLIQISSFYFEKFLEYKKILKQRNKALKICAFNLLNAFDFQLFQTGMELTKIRTDFINEFNSTFNEFCKKYDKSNSIYKIIYKSSWNLDYDFSLLNKYREQDVFKKTTTTGPHRDQYIILKDNYDFSLYASTGQRRILSLIFKMYQAEIIKRKTQKNPILLFDDVLLELDGKNKKIFLENLPDYEQAFFTVLPSENLENFLFSEKKFFYLKEGVFSNEKNW